MKRRPWQLVVLLLAACERTGEPEVSAAGPPPVPADCAFLFSDVTAASGIRFVHRNGARGVRQLPETMGGGAAWLDHDRDGDLDLFLVQSGPLPDDVDAAPARNALYRNDGAGRFTDVTAGAGDAAATGYGQGAAAGDGDGDGLTDLYVTNYGPDVLLRNRGDGGFAAVTAVAGIRNERWSVSAAWFDLENDGDLDLYVVNYLEYALSAPVDHAKNGRFLAYPHPDRFRAAPDVLYRNAGDGTFQDVTVAAGIRDVDGKGLSVIPVDLDDDGDLDLYVANDSTPNFLFENLGDGTFRDVTDASNTGYNADGRTEAGMGLAAGDVDGDLRADLFVTNLDGESNTLYRNQGELRFEDRTHQHGLARESLPFVGFGTGLLDADLDGDLDLLVANGHIIDNVEQLHPGSGVSYRQRCLLFANDGGGRFREEREALAPALAVPRVARAAAFSDYDDDGDVDVVLAQNAGPAVLLRNDAQRRGRFLSVRVLDSNGGDHPGARLLVTAGGRKLLRHASAAGSYGASGDPRVTIGVTDDRVAQLEVRWLTGERVVLEDVETDRFLTVRPDGTFEQSAE